MEETTASFNIEELKKKPVWQMTGEEFDYLICQAVQKVSEASPVRQDKKVKPIRKRYAYGIKGISDLFHCSLSTANRIKASGKINEAITQIGKQIIIDKDYALELAKQKNLGRRRL